MIKKIDTIRRIERRREVSAPSTEPTTLPKAMGHASPRFRYPREAYVAEPAMEITRTVASVVPETRDGRRVVVRSRSGAMAEPPPMPSRPPKLPPTRPIKPRPVAVRALVTR